MIDPRLKTISTASKSGTTVTSPTTAVMRPTTFSQRGSLVVIRPAIDTRRIQMPPTS